MLSPVSDHVNSITNLFTWTFYTLNIWSMFPQSSKMPVLEDPIQRTGVSHTSGIPLATLGKGHPTLHWKTHYGPKAIHGPPWQLEQPESATTWSGICPPERPSKFYPSGSSKVNLTPPLYLTLQNFEKLAPKSKHSVSSILFLQTWLGDPSSVCPLPSGNVPSPHPSWSLH